MKFCSTKCLLAGDYWGFTSNRSGGKILAFELPIGHHGIQIRAMQQRRHSELHSADNGTRLEWGTAHGTGPRPWPDLLGRTSEENSVVGESARTAKVTILVRHDQNIFREKHASSFDCRIAG